MSDRGGLDGGGKGGTFWTTAPGVITAVAALLTALSGVAFGLFNAGVFDPKETPTARTTPTPSPTPLGALVLLRNVVVNTSDEYPVLDVLLRNDGDTTGTLTEVDFRYTSYGCAIYSGAYFPDAEYDVFLGIKDYGDSSEETYSLSAPYDLDAGDQQEIRVAVGLDTAAAVTCRYATTVRFGYLGIGAAVEHTEWWSVQPEVTLYPGR